MCVNSSFNNGDTPADPLLGSSAWFEGVESTVLVADTGRSNLLFDLRLGCNDFLFGDLNSVIIAVFSCSFLGVTIGLNTPGSDFLGDCFLCGDKDGTFNSEVQYSLLFCCEMFSNCC